MGFGQAGAKRREKCLKVINWGGYASHKKGDSFHSEGSFSMRNTAKVITSFFQVISSVFFKENSPGNLQKWNLLHVS